MKGANYQALKSLLIHQGCTVFKVYYFTYNLQLSKDLNTDKNVYSK